MVKKRTLKTANILERWRREASLTFWGGATAGKQSAMVMAARDKGIDELRSQK